MTSLKLLSFACFLILGCINKKEENQSKSPDTSGLTGETKVQPPVVFGLIRQCPLISDTTAFIKQLRETIRFKIDESPEQKRLQQISYFKKIRLNGSDKEYVFLEYDYGVGSMALYPWKYQFLFTEEGGLVKTFTANRFELLPVFPDQNPFLLTLLTTAKGNGGHELYKFNSDTLENVYEGYYDYGLSTYDAHEDVSIYMPAELRTRLIDDNRDGFNDLVFQGTLALIQGRTPDGVWYDSLKAGGKTIRYSAANPFKKIPVEYVFLYDKVTGHFKAKEDYQAMLEKSGGQ